MVYTGSFTISNYDASYTYVVTPSTGVVQDGDKITAPKGEYEVTAKSGTCESEISEKAVINEQPATPVTPTLSAVTQPTCSIATGSFTISNYDASYTYVVTPSTGVVQNGNKITAPKGEYVVTAKSGTCESEISEKAVINEQPATPVTPTLSAVTQATCDTAIGNFIITNYDASYTYVVTPSTGVVQDGDKITAPKGEYIIHVVNGNCTTDSELITITEPSLFEAKIIGFIIPEFCAGDKDGAFSIEISGGNIPYSYSLNKESGVFLQGMPEQTVFDFENLSGGKHIVYIKDALGCRTQLEVVLPNAIVINPIVNITYSCMDNAEANTVIITVDPRITNPADVDYSLDGADFQPSNVFSNLVSGTHTVMARHLNGCTKLTKPFVIREVQLLTVVLSDGELNEIVVTAKGGDGDYQYSLDGESYVSSNKFIIYKSGTYTVTVVDENGCTAKASRYFEYIDVCISNYFTPNGDGVNDEWGPDCTVNYKNLTFTIFDRYGRIIGTYKLGQKWDGKYNGTELSSGDYWYVLKLNDNKDNREFVGHFTLYR